MYRNEIDIRRNVSNETLKRLRNTADKAFNNRVGNVKNTSDSKYRFIYEGGEDKYACLEVGLFILKREKEFLSCVNMWKWIDEENPNESCDVLEVLAEPVI